MQVKYTTSLDNFKYVAMFDLASKQTGFCLYDIKQKKPVFTTPVIVNHEDTCPFTIGLQNNLESLIKEIVFKYNVKLDEMIFVTEAMPTQVSSRASTIQTFLALAKAHAIFDHYLYSIGANQYDFVGIYPATTHSYFKAINGLDAKAKIDKKDIKNYVINEYSLSSNISYDESDAVFLAKTFCERKWNNDIDEKIRELKRHRKELKMAPAIAKIDQDIEKLRDYKYKED